MDATMKVKEAGYTYMVKLENDSGRVQMCCIVIDSLSWDEVGAMAEQALLIIGDEDFLITKIEYLGPAFVGTMEEGQQ